MQNSTSLGCVFIQACNTWKPDTIEAIMQEQEYSDMKEHHDNAVNEFLTRQSYSYIECAVNLAVHTAGLDNVAAYLRLQAELLEDHG